jgi:hypothetical protein
MSRPDNILVCRRRTCVAIIYRPSCWGGDLGGGDVVNHGRSIDVFFSVLFCFGDDIAGTVFHLSICGVKLEALPPAGYSE